MIPRNSVNVAKVSNERITLLSTLHSSFQKADSQDYINLKFSVSLEKAISLDLESPSKVIGALGPLVEEAEGRLRLQLQEVYFHRLNILLSDTMGVDIVQSDITKMHSS